MEITYTFDSLNFATNGVKVSKATGLIGRPNRKKPEKYEYPDQNGYVADLATVKYEARKITLECYIKASTVANLISNFNSFTAALQGKSAVKTLAVSVGGNALSFSAYVDEITDLEKRFADGTNVGTFRIIFIEPEPAIS
jgi:hypothetical protein